VGYYEPEMGMARVRVQAQGEGTHHAQNHPPPSFHPLTLRYPPHTQTERQQGVHPRAASVGKLVVVVIVEMQPIQHNF
jgi:hypothetical protein